VKRGLLALAAFYSAVVAGAPAPARESVPGKIHWETFGMFVTTQPSLYGGELGIALLTQPVGDLSFFVAPRMSLLGAWGDQTTRWDLNTGIEATLWAVNAIGVGAAADVAIPSYDRTGGGGTAHFRFQPLVGVRLSRLTEDGAWALRIGVPYDTRYSWGFQVGMALQFSGVPFFTGGN